MKIEKKNNKYRVRKTIKGKTYSFLFDNKPTKSEILSAIHDIDFNHMTNKMSLYTAMIKYCESKSNILSPSTIETNYKTIRTLAKQNDYLSTTLEDMTQLNLQSYINSLSRIYAPKTIKNIYSQIKSSYELFSGRTIFKITLPRRIKKEPYIPTDNDIKLLLQYFNNTKYEIPIRLALYSLRLSEITALTINDIDNCVVKVNKAKVHSTSGWVIKSTKTLNSIRDVKIDKKLYDKIISQGYVYKGDPKQITRQIQAFCKNNNIPNFSIHKLRHYFASALSELIPQQYLQKMGGWSDDGVMKKVYTHTLQDRHYEDIAVDYMQKL